VIPDKPDEAGDLYVPDGGTLDAMTGDRVVARVLKRGVRGGRMLLHGRITEVLERARDTFVGEMVRSGDMWLVVPQGRAMTQPIVVDDVKPGDAAPDAKVVVQIVRFQRGPEPAHGVIVERLGPAGPIDVETLGIVREHGLPDRFGEDVLAEASAATLAFDEDAAAGVARDREDFTGSTVVTIDPPDARDYDDAVGVEERDDGWTLAVHIADVSAFVPEGGALDREARLRGNSVYFPRKVLPMLPEALSNGACSLQPGRPRLVKSVLVDYDRDAEVVGARFANGVIRSARRLTYVEAQGVIDGRTGGYPPEVVATLGGLDRLAHAIERRRRREGMLHLDLPEVGLVLSEDGRVLDAAPPDTSWTHTLIEMCMVEANEAVARNLDPLGVPFLRRVHPEADAHSTAQLSAFLAAAGVKFPKHPDRRALQALLDRVAGTPLSNAVNLAFLKTLKRAEYSPADVGHFALASRHYCHFTSPIRRYPDLHVHRLLDAHLRGRLADAARPAGEVEALGRHCTATERRADEAEGDLRMLLVLTAIADRIRAGEAIEPEDGVITGVASFGMFVQSSHWLIEGVLRLDALPHDWWEADPARGVVVGARSRERFRLGDRVTVTPARVDLPARRLEWAIESH